MHHWVISSAHKRGRKGSVCFWHICKWGAVEQVLCVCLSEEEGCSRGCVIRLMLKGATVCRFPLIILITANWPAEADCASQGTFRERQANGPRNYIAHGRLCEALPGFEVSLWSNRWPRKSKRPCVDRWCPKGNSANCQWEIFITATEPIMGAGR